MAKTLPTRKALIYGVGEITKILKIESRLVRHWRRVRKAVKSGQGIGVNTHVPLLQRMKQTFLRGSYQVGRPGKKALNALKKSRKNVAKAVMESTPRAHSRIDKVVNARGNGIRFIRRGGRIIPIRVKK